MGRRFVSGPMRCCFIVSLVQEVPEVRVTPNALHSIPNLNDKSCHITRPRIFRLFFLCLRADRIESYL